MLAHFLRSYASDYMDSTVLDQEKTDDLSYLWLARAKGYTPNKSL